MLHSHVVSHYLSISFGYSRLSLCVIVTTRLLDALTCSYSVSSYFSEESISEVRLKMEVRKESSYSKIIEKN